MLPAENRFVDMFSVTPDGATYAYDWHHQGSQLYLVEGLQ